jgi:hypothetical protein
MSCFEYLRKVLWCKAAGDFVDPRICTTCDDAGCGYSRAYVSPRRSVTK